MGLYSHHHFKFSFMGAITGIIGAASGALGGILGSASRNRKIRQQLRMLEEQKAENQNWYDRRYNEDATQRADAVAALTRMQEMLRERNRQAAATQAVAGGTDESVAADRAASTEALANTTGQIAMAGEARKDQIENQYRARQHDLDEQRRALTGQKANGYDYVSNAIGGGTQGFTNGYLIDLLAAENKKENH